MSERFVDTGTDQPAAEDPALVLVAARQTRGLSQESVATSLKLTLRMLQQLEMGNYDRLPGDTFTRGYIRSYARLLGLDANRLALDYDRVRGIEARERQVSAVSKIKPAGGRNLLKISTLVIVLAIVLSLFFWWREQQPRIDYTDSPVPSVSDSSPITEPEVTVDALDLPLAVVPETALAGPQAPQGPEVALAGAAAADAAPAELAGTEATVPPGQADAASQDSQEPVAAEPDTDTGNRLALAFSADCWVQVTGVDGQSLHSGLMRAGQSLELTHEAGMALVLGAAEAVSSARFNGETIQLSTNGQPSGVVRIRLGE